MPTEPNENDPSRAAVSPARQRLRQCWVRFGELAKHSGNDLAVVGSVTGEHRQALDELVADGEISASVAELVQEACNAVNLHIVLTTTSLMCYRVSEHIFSRHTGEVLANQAKVLNEIAAGGTVNPGTLAKVQTALEHDLGRHAITKEEANSLSERILKEADEAGKMASPEIVEVLYVEMTRAVASKLTPEAQAATQFIIDLLMGK